MERERGGKGRERGKRGRKRGSVRGKRGRKREERFNGWEAVPTRVLFINMCKLDVLVHIWRSRREQHSYLASPHT